MKYKSTAVNMQPEILKRKLGGELLSEITLNFEGVTSGVVKAGSPISAAGVVANDGNAVGILYTDVHENNPNGTLIKAFACVNEENCNKNSGLTLAAEAKAALSLIVFE